jgi:hypothetical protein
MAAMLTEEARADLRERLVAICAALGGRLVKRIDGGDIALLGSVGAAIATLDAMPTEAEAGAMCGRRSRLTQATPAPA